MKKAKGRRQKKETAHPGAAFLHSACARALILLVRIYRLTVSPAKTFLFGPASHCRFEPSCSQYAIEAVKTHGALAGGWLAAKRVCRCHPWGSCGEDPVPPINSQGPHPELRISNAGFRT